MKKLNLAFIATALMFSFGCQKEIESTDQQPNQEVEIQEKSSCEPSSTTYIFQFQNVTTTPWQYGSVQTGSIVYPGPPSVIGCYPNIFVTSHVGIFNTLWAMINGGASQATIKTHLENNWNEFSIYLDPCIMEKVAKGYYNFEMYNYQLYNGVEYMFVYDDQLDLLYVYELYYN